MDELRGARVAARVAALIVATIAGLAWLPMSLRGQELSTAVGHYHLDVWRRQDAVRLAFTSNLVQTRDGYLWLSTQSGLARFDGVRFTVFDPSNTPALRGLAKLETYPLVADPRGGLWIGSDAGLYLYENGRVRPVALDPAFATDQVNAAVLDSSGAVWGVTRSERIVRITRDGTIRPLPGTAASYAGSGVAVDAAGDLWVAAGAHAVYRVRHGTLSAVAFPPGLHLGPVNHVYAAADSSVWFGTASAIVRWRRGAFRRVPLPPTRALGAVSAFAVAPDGALWVGTEGAGLYRYDGRRFTAFTTRDGLSDDRIVDILIDRGRNVWVATRDGLNRLRPEPFRVITRQNGLPADLPGAMIRSASGAVWVAPPTGGLFRGQIDADGARFAAVAPPSRADRVTVLVPARNGTILTGWSRGSVRRSPAGAPHGPTIPHGRVVMDGLPPVTDVMEDPDGTLWVGTWYGLYCRRPGRRTRLTTRDGLPDDAVQRLLRDAGGTLWVATQTGVARASGAGPASTAFTRVAVPAGAAARALTVFERPRGSVWIGSAQGLARVTGGRPVLLTTAQGLPEDWVGAAEADGAGHVWLAQLGGLTRVDAADLDSVADGAKPALTTAATFEALDGMAGGDPSIWGHPWSFPGPFGTLWFAVGHGIVVVDPKTVERDTTPPVLHVEQVTADGATVAPAGVHTLGPGVRRLELHYTGVDLTNGAAVRFRYRLDGFDTAWVDAGTQRVASYTRLAPGRYRFRVAGRGGAGGWSPEVAAVDVLVEPPLYQRPWFAAAAVLAAALALWAGHLAALRTRSDAVRDERSRLAREIHDSLLQGFGGIALQLHAAAARLALPPAQQALLDRVLSLADRTLTQARAAVWDIRGTDDAALDLPADCADAARRILGDATIAVRVETRARPRPLARAAHAEVLRIVEEALTNVRRHAAAPSAVVTLDYGWRHLRVTIADDGVGFDRARGPTPDGHWGLLGMRERASRIGGRFGVASAPGAGTVVSVAVRSSVLGMVRRVVRPED
ncbi:hypothetical protein tb265_49460 [Gemmatimonadetes bacterium T265]|nr:hypothetical protein tb265_49460 [Gemmatimonadetes bacterium T265]